MDVKTPEWLVRRSGGLQLASDGQTWLVLLGGEPLYSVVPVPVGGKFGSTVKQTNNGKRIPTAGTLDSPGEAVRGGLEDLRKALGW